MAIVDGQGNRLHIASVTEHRILGGVDLVSPRGVAFSPDSKTAFVTLGGGSLAIIDVDGVGVGGRRN
jgi:hypothetical protein